MREARNGGSGSRASRRGKSVALGAGIGMIFGAAFGAPGPGLVLGAALGVAGAFVSKRGG